MNIILLLSPRAAQSTLVGVVMFSKVFISGTIFPLPVGIVRVSTDAYCLFNPTQKGVICCVSVDGFNSEAEPPKLEPLRTNPAFENIKTQLAHALAPRPRG